MTHITPRGDEGPVTPPDGPHISLQHRDELRAPFDKKQIGRLPKTAKRPALDFVGHATVTDRLNTVLDDWTYRVNEMFTFGDACWVHGTMTIDGVSRDEYGDGDDPKAAIGNFIRRAAMRFGVAIDLWSREELSPAPPVVSQEPRREADHAPHRSNGIERGGTMTTAGSPEPSPSRVAGETPVAVVAGDTPSEGVAGATDSGVVVGSTPPPSDVLAQLLEAVGGSEVKAVNAINRAAKTSYSAKDLEVLSPDEHAAGLAAITMGGTP